MPRSSVEKYPSLLLAATRPRCLARYTTRRPNASTAQENEGADNSKYTPCEMTPWCSILSRMEPRESLDEVISLEKHEMVRRAYLIVGRPPALADVGKWNNVDWVFPILLIKPAGSEG